MPKPIEKPVYRTIEWNLHNVAYLRRAVENKRAEVVNEGSMKYDPGTPRGMSKHSDPTAVKALAIVDCKEARWIDAIQATYDYYTDFTMEGKMARLFYGKSATVDFVAEKMSLDRRTISYYRDAFVTRCALFALERGLIRLSKDGAEA